MPIEEIKRKDGETVIRWVFPPPVSGTEAATNEVDPPEAVIPGVAYRGHTSLLSGAPKAGKTTLLRDWIRNIARAHDSDSQHAPFMLRDRLVPAARVLIFSEEAPYQWDSFFQEMRIEGLCRYSRDNDGGNRCDYDWIRVFDRRHAGITPQKPTDRLLWIESVIELVKAWEIDLVVIDPLTRFLALASENDNSEVLTALVQLERIASEGDCALLMLHHTGKAGGQARGASAFLQNADVLLTLRHAREEEEVDEAPDQDHVRILTGTGRFEEIEHSVACWRTDRGFEATTTVTHAKKMTQTEIDADAIVSYMRIEQPSREMLESSEFDGFPGNEIRDACKLDSIRLHRAVKILTAKNAVRKVGLTRNTRYYLV